MSRANKTIIVTYILGFIMALPSALPAYIYSTFLSQFASEKLVGLIYVAASLLSIITFAHLPRILGKIGNTRTALYATVVGFLSFAGLAFSANPALITAAFIVNSIVLMILIFNVDVFLEHSSREKTTGTIRGIYLVCINSAWVVSQIFASFLIPDSNFRVIFIVSSLFLLPTFLIVYKSFGRFSDPVYDRRPFWENVLRIFKHKDLSNILLVNFLLQFFYSWMVIYTPIYLHNHLGFSWPELGIVFSIMLLPFVVVEAPLGRLADRWLGEKELLVAGFIIMAVMSGIMPFIASKNLALWTLILFLSRIGASTVEVMSETYFFKKVKEKDVNTIGTFRTTRPWAYVFAPIIATFVFIFVDFKFIFLALGVIMLIGVRASLALRDTA